MGDYVEVARVGELDDGSMIMFTYEGKELLVARLGNSYYCVDNRCPHMVGDLSKGTLDGTVITCPRHHSQFDI
jgi:3-phenylpropionate/trans-cinnamate dioxygenase ferredoxin component